MPSNHLILCLPLLYLPSVFPRIKVFSSESVLHIRWPKYWSLSLNISPTSGHPGLIFRVGWLDLPAVQGALKSLLQYHSSKASILHCSAFFPVQLSYPYMTTGKTTALTRQEKNKSILDKQRGNGIETQKTGKGIVNENGVWEVKTEGGKVQREGREHSSTWPSAPISRPQRLGGVGRGARVSQTSHTDAFFFPNYLLFLLVLSSPTLGKKKGQDISIKMFYRHLHK